MLNKLDEAIPPVKPTPGGNSVYQKIMANLKKELINTLDEIYEEGEEEDYKKDLAAINKAKTISDCADVARDLAWDYESFIHALIDSIGGKERANSALYDSGSWDT